MAISANDLREQLDQLSGQLFDLYQAVYQAHEQIRDDPSGDGGMILSSHIHAFQGVMGIFRRALAAFRASEGGPNGD